MNKLHILQMNQLQYFANEPILCVWWYSVMFPLQDLKVKFTGCFEYKLQACT